jgi:hypothetical protein
MRPLQLREPRVLQGNLVVRDAGLLHELTNFRDFKFSRFFVI